MEYLLHIVLNANQRTEANKYKKLLQMLYDLMNIYCGIILSYNVVLAVLLVLNVYVTFSLTLCICSLIDFST